MSDKLEPLERGQQPQSAPFRPITEGATPQGWSNIQGGVQPQRPAESNQAGGIKPPASK